jgi:hypothetical protein
VSPCRVSRRTPRFPLAGTRVPPDGGMNAVLLAAEVVGPVGVDAAKVYCQ